MNSIVFSQLLKELHNEEKKLHSQKQGSYAPGDNDVLTNFKDQEKTVKVASDMHAALILMEKHRLALLEVALGNINEPEETIRDRVRDIRLYMALFYGLWLDSDNDGILPIDMNLYDLEADEPEEESLADWKEVENSPMLGCLVDLPPDAIVRIKGTLYSFALARDDESYRTFDEAIPDQLIFGDDVTKDQKIQLIMNLTFEMIKSGEIPSECKDCPEIGECFLHYTTDPDPETPTPLQEAWRSAMEIAVEDEKENIAIDDFLADQLDEVRDEGAVKDWVRVGWEAAKRDGTLDEYVASIETMGENLPVMDQGGPVAEGLDKVIADMIEDGSLQVVGPETPDYVTEEKPMTFEDWDVLRDGLDASDLLPTPVELESASLLDQLTIDFIREHDIPMRDWYRIKQDTETGEVHMLPIVGAEGETSTVWGKACARFPESCGDCSLRTCNAHPSNSEEVREEDPGAADARVISRIQEACEELGVEGFEIFDEDPRIGDLRKQADEIEALTGWLGDQTKQLRADTIDLMEEKEKRGESLTLLEETLAAGGMEAEEPVRTMFAPDEDEQNMVRGTVRHTDRDVPEVGEHIEETDDFETDFASKWGEAPDR